LQTPDGQRELLLEAGFASASVEDRSSWYRRRVQAELQELQSDLLPQLIERIGASQAEHFVENWRALQAVCEKGDLLQVYSRGQKAL
jgi:hypothetical protein